MKGHQARKRFGQHFLTSDHVIQRIVHAISPQPGETIVEIGPGQGAITTPLAHTASTLHAIEFDRDLVPMLTRRFVDNNNVTVYEADALDFDFRRLGNNLRVVGNLPYNISTPLLFRLLQFKDTITDMHFMLQKEVVDRMAAEPGNKNYGRLTIMLGCHLEVVPLFDVLPDAFSPPPKVMSSIVRMRPIPQPHFEIQDAGCLESLVKLAFSRRRKTLRNALQGMATESDLDAVGLDATLRPEQVPIAQWIDLSNAISKNASDAK